MCCAVVGGDVADSGERPLPYAQQRAALRDAGAFADGADDRGVEGIVEGDDGGGVAVCSEEEREGGGCVGGDGER